jgi:hypothetical protein
MGQALVQVWGSDLDGFQRDKTVLEEVCRDHMGSGIVRANDDSKTTFADIATWMEKAAIRREEEI